MKKILVNGTLLAAVALGLAGCMAKKTERCQLGFFDNLNSAKKVANKILKNILLPISADHLLRE